MKKETDPRAENAVRIIQNVLIAVLFASALVLSAACFVLMTASANVGTAVEPFDISEISGHPDDISVKYEKTEFAPSVIAVSDGAAQYAAYGKETVSAVYKLALEDIASLISQPNAGLVKADEAEWTLPDSAAKYVYFRYRSSVPLGVVFDYAGVSASAGHDATDGRFASEVLIKYNGADAVVLISSPDGVYSVHGTVSSVRFESMKEMMRESAAYPFDIQTDSGKTVLLTSGAVKTPRCSVVRGTTATELGKQKRDALLAVFGMNPDKVKTNEHTTGVTFVDVSGTIVVGESVTYTAYQGGVSVPNSDGASALALTGCLRASDKFIAEVSGALGISLPETRFESVTADGSTLTFRYLYCYDNIPLVADGDLGITVSFAENSIVSFDMDIVNVSPADGECVLPDSHIVYGAYSKLAPDMILPVLVAGTGSSDAYSEWRAIAAQPGDIGGGDR